MLESVDPRLKFLLGVGASLCAKYAIAALMRRHRDDQFELVGVVKELAVFPVKSCQGVYVEEAECTKHGLKVNGVTDRHFMVVRPNGHFLSQRQNSKMALIKVTLTDKNVLLSGPGMKDLVLPKDVTMTGSNLRKVAVWECKTEGLDCGDEAARWVSQCLDQEGLRVVYYSHALKPRYFKDQVKPWDTQTADTDVSGFADWGSYLLLTTSSLEALNEQLPSPVTMRNFRPNIVVEGTEAFDEDVWEEVIIGEDVRMRCLDGCARCTLTTVDPDRGERRSDGEPLKTLQRIRMIPPYDKFKECVFGINLAPDVCGTVKVGDPVYAIRGSRA